VQIIIDSIVSLGDLAVRHVGGGRAEKTYVTGLQHNSKVMHPLWHMERGLNTKNQVTTTVSIALFTFAYISVTMNQVLGSFGRTGNEFFWVQVFNLVNQSGGISVRNPDYIATSTSINQIIVSAEFK